MAGGTYHHGVLVWDLAAGQRRMVELTAPTWIRHLAWSPDGRYLAGGGADGTVYIWDAADRTLLHRLAGHHSTITSVSWRPDGAQLASASSGQAGAEIFVWDMQRGERRHAVVGDSTMIYASAWGSDMSIVVGGGLDGTMRWWNLDSSACVRERAAHQGTVQSLRRSPDGTKLASCGDDGRVIVWDLHSGAQLQTLRRDRPYERLEITGLTGITDAQRASLLALGAVEDSGDDQAASSDRRQSIASLSHPITDQPQPNGARHVALGPARPGRRPFGLPFQPTTFVGRSAELAALTRMLGEPACRLLTLLGPGGIGKTRLALELATRLTDAFPDGVACVALASIGAADQIVSAIGETLNLSFTEQPDPTAHVLRHLRERHMLIILDSFEHLTAGADLVAEILHHAPRVSVVVTSRERLNLQAEWLFDVEGLSYPPESNLSLEAPPGVAELATYSAIQLFEQRARQVQPGLSLSQTTLATIARICQQVEGMPLAIELAAANVRTAPLTEIERQIRSNLDVLTTTRRDAPARHRSLRAVFEHSWKLLDEPERIVVSRLAVFCGGWTAPAAEEVAGATLPAITTLIDKSLVRQATAEPQSTVVPLASGFPEVGSETEQRFVLPEPVREYAHGQLVARGDAETPAARPCDLFPGARGSGHGTLG